MAKATQYQQDFAAKMQKEEDDLVVTLPTVRVISDEEKDPFDSVSTLLDELRDGGEYGELSVYGRPKQQPGQPAQRGNAFLMTCDATAYTLGELMAYIQDSWGEGVYTLRAKSGGKYAGQRTIAIGPSANKPETIQPPSVSPVDTTKQLAEMFDKMLRQQTETMAAMLGNVLVKLDRPALDPMALQRDTIGMIASMREVFAPPPQPQQAASATSSFSQLKELLELKKLLVNEESTETNPLMDMAKTFLPALIANAGNTSAPPEAVKPVHTVKPSLKPVIKEDSAAMSNIMNGLKTLCDAAKRGADVDLYAELILDQFGIEKVKSFIASPDALNRLALFSNDVKLNLAWFEKLRTVILAWIDEAEHDDTSETDPGNTVTVDVNPVGG